MATFAGKAWAQHVGALDCVLVQGSAAPPKTVVLMCHGFGAPGDDLVPVSLELMHLHPKLNDGVLFVFPEAPLDLANLGMPGARAWWMLDMQRLMAIQRGDPSGVQRMRNETPNGLEEAHVALKATLDEVLKMTSVPFSKCVIGGFSQGAMITTDLVLRADEAPAGLAILSGTVIREDTWEQLAPKRAGLRVVQSHGRVDPILPYDAAEDLRDLLKDAGLNVDFTSFNGGHTIGLEAMEKIASLIEETMTPG